MGNDFRDLGLCFESAIDRLRARDLLKIRVLHLEGDGFPADAVSIAVSPDLLNEWPNALERRLVAVNILCERIFCTD